MDLMQRRRVMLAAGKRRRLPPEYQEVEWLKSTGAQYIDTGKPFSHLFVRFRMTSLEKERTVLGEENRTKWYNTVAVRNNWQNRIVAEFYNRLDNAGNYIAPDMLEHTAELYLDATNRNIGHQVLDGVDKTITPVYIAPYNLYLFADNVANTPKYFGKCCIYEYKKWSDDGIIEQELIRCYRKSDNKPGMYDLCSSICPLTNSPFYINAGTGEFLVGPDVN